MRLVHKDTGAEVKKGETVTDFRGDDATVTGWREPHNSNSTGRVIVQQGKMTREFYPSVYDLKWVD